MPIVKVGTIEYDLSDIAVAQVEKMVTRLTATGMSDADARSFAFDTLKGILDAKVHGKDVKQVERDIIADYCTVVNAHLESLDWSATYKPFVDARSAFKTLVESVGFPTEPQAVTLAKGVLRVSATYTDRDDGLYAVSYAFNDKGTVGQSYKVMSDADIVVGGLVSQAVNTFLATRTDIPDGFKDKIKTATGTDKPSVIPLTLKKKRVVVKSGDGTQATGTRKRYTIHDKDATGTVKITRDADNADIATGTDVKSVLASITDDKAKKTFSTALAKSRIQAVFDKTATATATA